jgi:hypothetical protein
MIPKPSIEEGLGIEWPAKAMDKDKLKELYEAISAKM